MTSVYRTVRMGVVFEIFEGMGQYFVFRNNRFITVVSRLDIALYMVNRERVYGMVC